jgi:glycosyltransferase involved in cell wall biosynthesis
MPHVSLEHHAGVKRLNAEIQVPHPLISVVIVVFRDRDELRQVIESILPHKNQSMEIIVIDGGSDDGTVELLRALDPQIDYWVSEPDKGIYDAMNKGLEAASGEYILHLNAGDRLRMVPWDALRKHAEAQVDVVCCRVLIDSQVEYVSRTGLLSRIDNTWHHQGTFYRRATHLGYDVTYRTGGDFDHNQRLLKAGCSVKNNPCVIADHQNSGVSMVDTGHREIFRSVKANFGRFYLMLSWFRFKLIDIRCWIRRRGKTPTAVV